jgi:hypothetical protein
MKRLAFLLLLLPMSALAGDYVKLEDRLTAEQRIATGVAGLSAAQLELLNSILSGVEQEQQRKSRDQREQAAEREATLLETLDGRPIQAVAKGTFASWEPGTLVELDNGQRWKVLKGYGKLRAPRTDLPVRIVPGMAGRWFMEFDENLPKARVFRID